MIEGIVNAYYEPVVTLSVQGPDGEIQEIEAVVDTGYNGLLTLPPSIVSIYGCLIRAAARLDSPMAA